jgi:hypothetical protein
MASKDQKMSKQGTAGKRKHMTSMIPQELERIRRLEELKTRYGFIQHWTVIYLCYKDVTGGIRLFVALSESVKGLFK